MKISVASLTIASAVLVASVVQAQEEPVEIPVSQEPAAATKLDGDVITEQNRIDIAEMIRIADALDSAIDAKKWNVARKMFTNNVNADFSSLNSNVPGTMPSKQLVDDWANDLTENKTSFHMRSNHRVTFFSDDEAVMLSHGYAWNRLASGAAPENGANAFWEVWGNYTHVFQRTPKGWKVNGIKFDMTAERGNPYVRNTPGS